MNKQKELLDLNWNKHFEKVKHNIPKDQVLKNNSKLGLSLLTKIPQEMHQLIAPKIQELKTKYPNQFFYPVDRIHLTVTGLIAVQENMTISDVLLEKLSAVLEDTLQKHSAFEVELDGLNITSSSVFIQGYYTNYTLDRIRKEIISNIQAENLELNLSHLLSFDLGYAWLTVMRFTDDDIPRLLEDIKEMRTFEFGKFTVNEIQLVITDKYFSQKKTKVVNSFCLQD